MADDIMTAERITAPVIRARLMGEERDLRFDNRACMMAERFWREVMGQRVSYFFILGELQGRTYGGMMAVAYGAMASAVMQRNRSRREPLPLPGAMSFSEGVTMEELLACQQDLIAAAGEALPKAKKADGDGEA